MKSGGLENYPELVHCQVPGGWVTWARRTRDEARQEGKHQTLKDPL